MFHLSVINYCYNCLRHRRHCCYWCCYNFFSASSSNKIFDLHALYDSIASYLHMIALSFFYMQFQTNKQTMNHWIFNAIWNQSSVFFLISKMFVWIACIQTCVLFHKSDLNSLIHWVTLRHFFVLVYAMHLLSSFLFGISEVIFCKFFASFLPLHRMT